MKPLPRLVASRVAGVPSSPPPPCCSWKRRNNSSRLDGAPPRTLGDLDLLRRRHVDDCRRRGARSGRRSCAPARSIGPLVNWAGIGPSSARRGPRSVGDVAICAPAGIRTAAAPPTRTRAGMTLRRIRTGSSSPEDRRQRRGAAGRLPMQFGHSTAKNQAAAPLLFSVHLHLPGRPSNSCAGTRCSATG